ncbi:MAG: hypothetical protein WAL40_07270 [Rhodoplanes sp.]
MDSPEQALSKVLEAAQALIRLDGAEPSAVPQTAGNPKDVAACQPVLQIESIPLREAACGHKVSVDRKDRIAVPLPPFPGIARLRTAMLSGALVAALGFASGWLARSYVYPPGSDALTTPTGMQGADFSTDSPGKTRTVSRELPLEGRALLDTIAGSESAYPGRDPYKVIYGGRVAETLTDHPRQYFQIVAGPNTGQKTSAAGRYQYLERSWDEASTALGLPDFSPASQDKAAFWEAQRTYRAKTGRDLVTDIRDANADPEKLALIGRGISSWWTSLPGGIEPNNATSSFGDRFAQNLLYYKSLTQPVTPSDPPDNTGAIKPAPPPATPRPGSDAPAETQAAPEASRFFDPKEKATTEVRDEVLPPATTKSNRAPARVTTQTANAMSSPRRRIPTAQASGGAHRTERPSSLIVEPETRPTTIDGWIVRDVIGNTAVLEGPNGIRKVALGDVLPELGKVDSILRWGKRWIVSTERGLISTL